MSSSDYPWGNPSRFARLPAPLQASPAFQSLTPQAKLVCIDMMNHWDRYTGFGHQSITENSFYYTYAHCCFSMNKNTFRAAVDQIQDRGIFAPAPPTFRSRPGSAFTPSTRWRTYKPTLKARGIFLAMVNRVRRKYLAERADLVLNFGTTHQQNVRHPMVEIWEKSTLFRTKKQDALPIGKKVRSSEKPAREEVTESPEERLARLEYEALTPEERRRRMQALIDSTKLSLTPPSQKENPAP